ncbi:hypothetical protein [Geodermatophilus sp. URMC 63]
MDDTRRDRQTHDSTAEQGGDARTPEAAGAAGAVVRLLANPRRVRRS